MAEILLFHSALGLTPGCRAFADELRSAGHVVHTPDLYDGMTFADVAEGVNHAQEIGFDTVVERGRRRAEDLPGALVYAGFSLGVMPAQMLAQTRPGARGAVLMHSAVPLGTFAPAWPPDVALQVHTKEKDDWGDADIAKDLVDAVPGAELYLYEGDRHLFTDRSAADFEPEVARALMARVLDFVGRVA